MPFRLGESALFDDMCLKKWALTVALSVYLYIFIHTHSISTWYSVLKYMVQCACIVPETLYVAYHGTCDVLCVSYVTCYMLELM